MSRLRALIADCTAIMTVETAIVAPVLVAMALGTYDVSSIVSRQSELQSAAAEAAAIVQANPPITQAQRDVIRNVLSASTGIPTARVTVTPIYRCDTDPYVTTNTCTASQQTSVFIQLRLIDTYSPFWTSIGAGSPMNYNVLRMVQIS
ncbi:MAG: TadE/TadG family type IV pilus assembly protein [Croceibacterium sp.]